MARHWLSFRLYLPKLRRIVIRKGGLDVVFGHRWDGGWVAGALAGLAQDAINLH